MLSSAHLGFALSTTQVVSGAVVGSAAACRAATVHRRVLAAPVATAWLLTLPGAALVGAFATRISATGTAGTVLVTGLLLVAAAVIYGLPRRTRVTATTINDTPTPPPLPATA